MTVRKTSLLNAGKQTVFEKLKVLKTLQYIAAPMATFIPVEHKADLKWEPGETVSFRLWLFGIIPFGIHTIHVDRFDVEQGIYTNERNAHVPIWNHEILLEERSDGNCRYTDIVEIGAGWKTPFIWLWANWFYAHRQRKWIQLLKLDPD